VGWLPGSAPSQLLPTCSSAEHEKLKKALDFTATTENISVLSTFFCAKSKTQKLLGRK